MACSECFVSLARNAKAIGAVCAYLIIGTLVYTYVFPLADPESLENVTLLDAAYFSLVTLTTVG